MTKAERRIRDFSSGMRKLDDKSLNYIHKLTQVLFMFEHPSIYPCLGEKNHESENISINIRRDKF
jgi:hypothetical protein